MDAEVTESAPQAKPDRTLLAVLIAVGLLVVIAVVVVLVRGASGQSFDASTPEGVVQRYAQAVIDGDDATAGTYLASRSEECDYYYGQDQHVRLTYRSTDISGDHAAVLVTVTTSYGGGLFSDYEYSNDDQFRLEKAGDSWLITDTPYEFISCGAGAGN